MADVRLPWFWERAPACEVASDEFTADVVECDGHHAVGSRPKPG
jgi:hypothetical protein